MASPMAIVRLASENTPIDGSACPGVLTALSAAKQHEDLVCVRAHVENLTEQGF